MNKHILWGFVFLAIFACFYIASGILWPFILSLIIAYIFSPLTKYLVERLKFNRYFVAGLCIIMLLVLFLAVGFFIVPIAYSQILKFISLLPQYQHVFDQTILPRILNYTSRVNPEYVSTAKESLNHFVSMLFQNSLTIIYTIWQSSFVIVNIITMIILVPLISFYLIADWHKLTGSILALVPHQKRQATQLLLQNINKALASFFRGQTNVCIILALYYSVALSFIKLDFALLLGTLTGLMSFIPIIGLLGGFLTALILAYLQFGSWHLVSVVSVFVVGNIIEGLISPRILGHHVGLHPVWIIFLVLLGAKLYGVVGMFLAVPFGTIVSVLLKALLDNYYNSSLYKS